MAGGTHVCVHCGRAIHRNNDGDWYHLADGRMRCVVEHSPASPRSLWWDDQPRAPKPPRTGMVGWWSRVLDLPRWGFVLLALLFLAAGVFLGKSLP
jgi:hypothetical protein